MKMWMGALAAAVAVLGATPGPDPAETLIYEVVAVKRHLFRMTTGGEQRLQAGGRAQSGESLRTGSRSSADLEVPESAARFHIGTKTSFHLAPGTPGVLLDVERGSLRAIFGKLPEGDQRERLVTTPSAVLAVRGTEYGVDVKKDGDTSVVVFDGTVEIRDRAGLNETVRVAAGQSIRIRKGRSPDPPKAHALTTEAWDRGRRSENSAWGSQGQIPGQSGAAGQPGASGTSPARPKQGGSARHGG